MTYKILPIENIKSESPEGPFAHVIRVLGYKPGEDDPSETTTLYIHPRKYVGDTAEDLTPKKTTGVSEFTDRAAMGSPLDNICHDLDFLDISIHTRKPDGGIHTLQNSAHTRQTQRTMWPVDSGAEAISEGIKTYIQTTGAQKSPSSFIAMAKAYFTRHTAERPYTP